MQSPDSLTPIEAPIVLTMDNEEISKKIANVLQIARQH